MCCIIRASPNRRRSHSALYVVVTRGGVLEKSTCLLPVANRVHVILRDLFTFVVVISRFVIPKNSDWNQSDRLVNIQIIWMCLHWICKYSRRKMTKFHTGRFLLQCACLLVIFSTVSKTQLPSDKPCFCQLSGRVHECACTVDTVDDFNNRKVYPQLQNLLEKNFFRYYKVSIKYCFIFCWLGLRIFEEFSSASLLW